MFDTPSRGDSRRPGRSSRRFALRRTVDKNWIIVHAHVPEFAVRPLAHITIDDDDVAEVIWTAPLPLPVMFATPQDALQSLEEWERGREGATKPIPIPHFPPRGGLNSASA
jgi:hypothetical protein